MQSCSFAIRPWKHKILYFLDVLSRKTIGTLGKWQILGKNAEKVILCRSERKERKKRNNTTFIIETEINNYVKLGRLIITTLGF